MDLKILTKEVVLNAVPLEKILINDGNKITILFDDISEERWEIIFRPFQAFKITTIDCVNYRLFSLDGSPSSYILEKINSNWIKELTIELIKHDHDAIFMDKAHHYILPTQDNMIEIIAWDNYILQKLDVDKI